MGWRGVDNESGEEGPGRLFDCAVAPRYPILRCAFQQVRSTAAPAFVPVSEREI